MANPSLTSSALINSVKLRAMIPQNQSTFSESDFLTFANEELQMGLIPMILRHHEEYFVVVEEIQLVSNKSEYAIPSRAIGNRLRDVYFRSNGGSTREMTRIDIQDIPYYENGNAGNGGNSVYAFYIKNNKIVLVPSISNINNGETLVISYYFRPGQIVSETRTSTITAINTTTGEITVSALPKQNNQVILSLSTKVDFIMATTPHITLDYDILPTVVNTTTNIITFAPADLPADLVVGDYINLAHETCVPQIPSDLHMQLAVRVGLRCLQAMGDTESVNTEAAALKELTDNASQIVSSRVDGSPKKIVNRHATLRYGLRSKGFRY